MAWGENNPKILICDIELSHDILASYGLREQYHHPSNILQEWFMICFAWKWLDGEQVHAYSLLNDLPRFRNRHTDDFTVVQRLHSILATADIVVGHNFDRFDWKKFMSKVIKYNLPPISKPAMIDTLKEARKLASFTSNKLDYLTNFLEVENVKQRHSQDMWLRILVNGDRKAIKECVTYCKGDIQATQDLYLKLRPYMDAHPNMNLWKANGVECCTACGGDNLIKNSTRITRTGRYQRYQCTDCGKWMQGTKRIKGVTIK